MRDVGLMYSGGQPVDTTLIATRMSEGLEREREAVNIIAIDRRARFLVQAGAIPIATYGQAAHIPVWSEVLK